MNLKYTKFFFIYLAIAIYFTFSTDLCARGGRSGGGRGGRGRSSGGRTSRHSSRSYGSVRHGGSFRSGPAKGRIAVKPVAGRLVSAGTIHGRAYYTGLPRGYRRIVRNNNIRYVYDNVYYRRVYHNGGYVYISE